MNKMLTRTKCVKGTRISKLTSNSFYKTKHLISF